MQAGSRHYIYRNRGAAMPKIDLANVEVIRRLVYPEPFYHETEGYEGQRVGNAAGASRRLRRPSRR